MNVFDTLTEYYSSSNSNIINNALIKQAKKELHKHKRTAKNKRALKITTSKKIEKIEHEISILEQTNTLLDTKYLKIFLIDFFTTEDNLSGEVFSKNFFKKYFGILNTHLSEKEKTLLSDFFDTIHLEEDRIFFSDFLVSTFHYLDDILLKEERLYITQDKRVLNSELKKLFNIYQNATEEEVNELEKKIDNILISIFPYYFNKKKEQEINKKIKLKDNIELEENLWWDKKISDTLFSYISKNLYVNFKNDPIYRSIQYNKKLIHKLLTRTMTQEEYYRHLETGDPVIDNLSTPLKTKDFLMNTRDEEGNIDTKHEIYQHELKRITLEEAFKHNHKSQKSTTKQKKKTHTPRQNTEILDKMLINTFNTYCNNNNIDDKTKAQTLKLLRRLQKNQEGKYRKDHNFKGMPDEFFELINQYGFTEIIVEKVNTKEVPLSGKQAEVGKDNGKNNIPDNTQDDGGHDGDHQLDEKNYLALGYLEGTIQKLTDLGYTFRNQRQFEKQFEKLTQGRGLFENGIKIFLENNEDISEKRLNYRKINIGGKYRRILIVGEGKITEIDGIYTHDDYNDRIKELRIGGRK